jgi:hypothetical protein
MPAIALFQHESDQAARDHDRRGHVGYHAGSRSHGSAMAAFGISPPCGRWFIGMPPASFC